MSRRLKVPEPLRPLAAAALKQRWTVTRTGGGHIRWKPPSGAPVFTPSTPGGGNRSIGNCLARLRRAGLRTETS